MFAPMVRHDLLAVSDVVVAGAECPITIDPMRHAVAAVPTAVWTPLQTL